MKILFIINPVAGTGKNKTDENFILEYFNEANFEVSIKKTTGPGSANTLALWAINHDYDIVVAVGGDGTVNEVAQALVGTKVKLGIVPRGSGNGLARHHKIPVNLVKTLEVIKRNHSILHDAITINEHLSFNVSGIGFDAHVAHLFGTDGTRGLYGYLKLVLSEFSGYDEKIFQVSDSESNHIYKAMMISIANSTQFGNEAIIAPYAKTGDGIVNLTLVRKMRFWKLPIFAIMVFAQKISSSGYASFLCGKEFTVSSDGNLPLHIDGESKGFSKEFKIGVIHDAFRMIVPV